MLKNSNYILGDRPFQPDDKAAKLLDEEARERLSRLTSLLQNASQWDAETLENAARQFSTEEGVKLGKIAQPLRAALTGRAVSPGVFDVMETLGQHETLARLQDASG